MKTRQGSGSLPCRKNNCTTCPGCRVDFGGVPNEKASSAKNGRAGRQRILTVPSDSCASTISQGSTRKAGSVTRGVGSVNGESCIQQQNRTEAERDSTESDSDLEFGPAHSIITDELIMKIDTKNYCIFCYKQCGQSFGQKLKGDDEDANSKEICSRYMKLLTRYLKLDIYRHVIPTDEQNRYRQDFLGKSLKKGEVDLDIQACDACFMSVKVFCDLYHQWQHIHLLLDWNISKFRNVMKCAEKVPSRVNEFREKVLEGKNGMRKEEKVVMDGFKREFFRKSTPKRFPTVNLQKLKTQSGTEKLGRTKTILVQKQLANDQLSETKRNIRAHAIDVLKIGQELRLTSRGQSDKKENANYCKAQQAALTINTKPERAGKGVSSQSSPERVPTIKSVVKSVNREVNFPISGGISNKTGKMPPSAVAPTSIARKSSRSSETPKGYRPGPASRVQRHVLDAQQLKQTVIYVKRPKLSNPGSSLCEVIDLCDSDNDEETKEEEDKEDIRMPTPAKKAKISQLPKNKGTPEKGIFNGTERQGQNEVDIGQNVKTRDPCIQSEASNKIPPQISSLPPPGLDSSTQQPGVSDKMPSPLSSPSEQDPCNQPEESNKMPHPVSSPPPPEQNPFFQPGANDTMPSPLNSLPGQGPQNLSESEASGARSDIYDEVLQQLASIEDTLDTRNCLPEFINNSVPSEMGGQHNNVQGENSAFTQPSINCNNEYLQDGEFLQTHVELPTPPEGPGQGIEVTLEPGNQKVHSVSVTITQTFTSTFSGSTSDGGLDIPNIPIPPMFPAFNPSVFPSLESFVQPFAGSIPTENQSETSNYSVSEAQPIVDEVEENDNLDSALGESSVQISEMVEGEGVVDETYDNDDVQIIETLDHETGKLIVVMKPTNVRVENEECDTDHTIVQSDYTEF